MENTFIKEIDGKDYICRHLQEGDIFEDETEGLSTYVGLSEDERDTHEFTVAFINDEGEEDVEYWTCDNDCFNSLYIVIGERV